MRHRTVLALGLMLTLVSAGCARGTDNGTGVATALSGGAKASGNPTASASAGTDPGLKFSQCMRQQGMTWFPDPDPDGRMSVMVPKGTDQKKLQAAQDACKKYAPAGPADGKPDPQMVERMRQMAQCMRANGVPKFPDPNANGSIALDRNKVGTGPGDPTFDKAQTKCSKYLPGGGQTTTNNSGQGGHA